MLVNRQKLTIARAKIKNKILSIKPIKLSRFLSYAWVGIVFALSLANILTGEVTLGFWQLATVFYIVLYELSVYSYNQMQDVVKTYKAEMQRMTQVLMLLSGAEAPIDTKVTKSKEKKKVLN